MSDARPAETVPTEAPASSRFSRITRAGILTSLPIFIGFLGVIWAAGLWVYFRALTNNDVAWGLVAADKWLAGARLYRDIVEVNPPLFIWIEAPAVVIARLTGIAATEVFVVYFFAIIAVSIALVCKATSVPGDDTKPLARVLALAATIAMVVFPARDFGQREHVMLVLTIPYLLLACRRAAGLPFDHAAATYIGLLAGIGLALKPPFWGPLPFLLELYLAIHRPSLRTLLRPELAALMVVFTGYAMLVLLLTPEYVSRIVPWDLLVYGEGYGITLWSVIARWQSVALLTLLALHLAMRSHQAHPIVVDILLICATAFYASYVVQEKGWTYQILPTTTMLFLTATVMLLLDPLQRGIYGALPAAGTVALAAMIALPLIKGTYENPTARTLLPFVRKYAAGASIYTFSSYLWVSFPLVNLADVRWASRFSTLWLLPGAERDLDMPRGTIDPELAKRLQTMEGYTVAAAVEDFQKDPPALVIVDRRPDPRFGGIRFDYLAWFRRDTRFAAIWSHYRLLREIATNQVGPFDLYVRVRDSAPR